MWVLRGKRLCYYEKKLYWFENLGKDVSDFL